MESTPNPTAASAMPATPLVTQGFHHVALRATDFDKAVAFYQGVLGLPSQLGWGQAPNRAVLLQAGVGQYIEIFEKPETVELNREANESGDDAIMHFAFRTPNLDEALAAVEQAGLEITMPATVLDIDNTQTHRGMPKDVTIKIAFFRGPCGELVELFEHALS